MLNLYDEKGNLLADEFRINTFGSWLRSSSIDELPTLINVLKGDMSFIGPRPLLPEYIPLYSKEQSLRLELKPGITGLAQISGRNMISWEEKFQYDIYYYYNNCLMLDIKILFITIGKVFCREGISPKGKSFMEKFKG